MRSTVLTTDDSAAWLERLRDLPDQDVYFRPEYHRAYEEPNGPRAYAFFADSGSERFFYPIMVSPIQQVGALTIEPGLSDAASVYGYSGPLATTEDAGFLEEAWSAYDAWARDAGIISELIRFHPLLENHRFAAGRVQYWRDRETVVIRLDRSEEELWNSYQSVQRNMLRKAERNGLTCRRTAGAAGLAEITPIYRETMAAIGAAERYHFDDRYFEGLTDGLGEALTIFTVFHEAVPVASAMFLLDGDTMHYHLSGSLQDYRRMAPNNQLLHEAALWGMTNGYRRLHLGGGRSGDPNCALLRFKASFSTDRAVFYLGKRVGNPEAYEELCRCWRTQAGTDTTPAYVQLYRLDPHPERAQVRQQTA